MSRRTRVAVCFVRVVFLAALALELLALHFPTPEGVPRARRRDVSRTWHAAADAGRAGGRFVPDVFDVVLEPLIDDKTAHVVLFFPLGLLAAAERRLFGPLTRKRVFWIALALSTYAVIGELSQAVLGRNTEAGDVVANVLGALLGVGFVALVTRAPRRDPAPADA